MTEHFDVLIIGAGISGIGTAVHLTEHCPDRTFALLEARADIGGTWDLFRYPGIRSDSDMHTLGFRFKPWTGEKAIADGPSILAYLHETVDEHELRPHIWFGHRAHTAHWSSEKACWTVDVERTDGAPVAITANFICMCAGYYSYQSGHAPTFPDQQRFRGGIVHPQAWPDDLDYADKKVVVIGSGATAMTLVPAMAETAQHVTLLQRSPSYVVARPEVDTISQALRRCLPERWAYALTRFKNILFTDKVYQRTRTDPEKVKRFLIRGVRQALGPDYDVKTHFTPRYNPWDQRLCLLPDGDLFKSINAGEASVVTGHIKRFTETGIELENGDVLPADLIVSATGLRMVNVGEMSIDVDGAPIDFSRTWTYKGFAYSDVPNLITTFGYINASWTLRADLIAAYTCRLLNHMKRTDTHVATPRLRPSDRDMTASPFIEAFSSGYMQRTMVSLPRQGDREPWINAQRYLSDRKTLAKACIADGVMQFTG